MTKNKAIPELRLVVKALIVYSEKVLVLVRSKDDPYKPGAYDLSGGRVEPGESFREAIVREIKEETGLDVEIIMPFQNRGWNIDSVHYEGLSFLA